MGTFLKNIIPLQSHQTHTLIQKQIPSTDLLMLSLGDANFTCCDRNHVFGNGKHTYQVECDRGIVRRLLENTILKKVEYLYDKMKKASHARIYDTLRCGHFVRGLPSLTEETQDTSTGFKEEDEKQKNLTQEFRDSLRWKISSSSPWFDENDMSILVYAALKSDIDLVRALLKELMSSSSACQQRHLTWKVRNDMTIAHFPLRNMNLITASMAFSQDSEIVSAFLQFGFCFEQEDFMFSPLTISALLGNIDNVEFWISHFPDTDLDVKNSFIGLTPLLAALGNNNFSRQPKMCKVLLKAGASIDAETTDGADAITLWAGAIDTNPDTFPILLDTFKRHGKWNPSRQRGLGHNFKWKMLNGYFICSYLCTKSQWLLGRAAVPGASYLFNAISNDDEEIVQLLLKAGVNPQIRCFLGYDALKFCDLIGPHLSMRKVLEGHVS
jgi:hypothetical protein